MTTEQDIQQEFLDEIAIAAQQFPCEQNCAKCAIWHKWVAACVLCERYAADENGEGGEELPHQLRFQVHKEYKAHGGFFSPVHKGGGFFCCDE